MACRARENHRKKKEKKEQKKEQKKETKKGKTKGTDKKRKEKNAEKGRCRAFQSADVSTLDGWVEVESSLRYGGMEGRVTRYAHPASQRGVWKRRNENSEKV